MDRRGDRDQQRTATALRDSQARLAGIIDSALDAIITVDSDQHILVFNRAAETMFGCAAAEALGQSLERFIPERFRAGHSSHIQSFGQTETSTRAMAGSRPIFGLRKGGEEFPIEASISQIEVGGQRLYTVILRDITERARADERFRLVVEAAPNAMLMADAAGLITLVNQQTEQLFGYQRAELLGQPIELLIPERYCSQHPNHRQFFAEHPTTRSMGAGRDLYGRRKDGSEVPIEIGLNPIQTNEGAFVLASIIDITERKRSEETFRQVIEHAPYGKLLVDKAGKITLVNAQIEKLFGYRREELLGQSIERLVPQRFRDRHSALRAGFTENPAPRSMGAGRELYGLRKDGSEFPVEIGLNPLKTEQGMMVLGTIVDISARMDAEQELRRSQEQLAGVIGSAMDAIISVDETQLIVLFNAAAERMFRCSATAAIGQPLDRFIPQCFHDAHRGHIESFGRTNVSKRAMGNLEAIFGLRGDGEEFPVEASISQIDVQGKKLFTVILRDITERKRAEEARRASEQRYRTLFECAPDGIVIADPDSYYLDANSTICCMLGYTRDELIGLHASDIVIASEVPHIGKALEVIKASADYHREWQFRRKDGSAFAAEVTATLMPDSNLLAVIRDITERKQSESALRASEERLRIVTENARVGLVMVNRERRYTFANTAYAEILGLPSSDIVGRRVADVLAPLYEEQIRPRLDRAFTGERVTYELRREEANEFRYYAVKYEPAEAANSVSLVVVVITDITERKQAEQALKAERQLLRTLIDLLPDYIYLKDTESNFLACNEACARLMGKCSPAELVGKTDADFYPAALAAKFRAEELAVLAGTPILNKEEPFTGQDGSVELILTTKLPIKDNSGTTTGLVGYGRNITASRQAEEARRASEARLTFALQTSQIGAWELSLLDHTATRTLIHDHIFGYQELLPDWTYEKFLEHVLPEDRAAVDRGFQAATATRSNWDFECRIRRADGEVRWIWAAGGHEKNAQNIPVRMSGIVQDITERKQAEEEIRVLNQDLEQRVTERTAQLQAVNKELEAFAYSVSHDLRAPLRHINGFSQALLEDCADKLDETGKSYLQEVRGASQEMAQLIDDVLQLARVSRSEMRREPVDLSELARSVVADLRTIEPGRNVAIEIAEGLATEGDKRLLRIMLVNLLGNAWKFTSKQEQPEISFAKTQQGDESIYFVSDNGAGFDMAFVGKLFGAFQRLHTAGEFEGTGIGLATVQRVVLRHGGRVWADGNISQGATFYFTLGDLKEEGNGEQSDLTG